MQIHQKKALQYVLQWQVGFWVAIEDLIDTKVVSRAINLLYVCRAIHLM